MTGRSVSAPRRTRWEHRPEAAIAVAAEQLESIRLLSALSPIASGFASPNSNASPNVTVKTPSGYTPDQIREAYGFNQIVFGDGIIGDGAGQTIAIVDAYNHPSIAANLKKFDKQFGLPNPPKFTKVAARGTRTDPDWALEIALDVEWAHAMAPQAKILLVEARDNSFASLLSAVDYARRQKGVSVISMSWGGSEFFNETLIDSYFTTPAGHSGVTFVASSGDYGAISSWPAVSPNVLSVGGTSLQMSQEGSYSSESGWSGSGGGLSVFEARPSYQQGFGAATRSFPDVAYNGDPYTGFAVYNTVSYNGRKGWFQVGGTSAGAPQWAALVAIVNQGRALSGLGPLDDFPSLAYDLSAASYHDIETGSNGYVAGVGFDLVTGFGSPIANQIVIELVGSVQAGISVPQNAPPLPAWSAAPALTGEAPAAIVASMIQSYAALPYAAPPNAFTQSSDGSFRTSLIVGVSVRPLLAHCLAAPNVLGETARPIPTASGSLAYSFGDEALGQGATAVEQSLARSTRRRQLDARDAIDPPSEMGNEVRVDGPINAADDVGNAHSARPETQLTDACFASEGWIDESTALGDSDVAQRQRSGTAAIAAALVLLRGWADRRRTRTQAKPDPRTASRQAAR